MHDNKEDISFKRLVDAIHQQAQAALDDPYVFKRPIKNVAVIGAGAHGLCSARHLKDVGMHVKVFERNSSVGGLWKYSDTPSPKPKVPTDCIMSKFDNLDKVLSEGSKGQRGMKVTPEVDELLLKKIPPSACYRDLQTNIPTKNFAFPDFPFSEGTPAFTAHETVLAYFGRYTDTFRLLPLMGFDTSIDQVIKAAEGSWELALSQYKRMSDVDIARSPEGFAKSITISIKGPFVSPNPIDNVLRQLIPKDAVIKSVIASFSNPDGKVDGSIMFEDGPVMKEVDQQLVIKDDQQSTKEGLPYADVPEGHVVLGSKSPLNVYHDTFLMSDPTFCFVSMPRFFSLSPYFDIQARTIARVWSNNAHIPSREKMHQIEAEFKPDIPVDPFASDRVRREMFVQWLNYQAEHMGRSDLTKFNSYDKSHEEELWQTFKTAGEATEGRFQRTREKLLMNTL